MLFSVSCRESAIEMHNCAAPLLLRHCRQNVERFFDVRLPSATVTALITAPCEALFAIVSDPTRHPSIAGSGAVMECKWLSEMPIRVGSVFKSRQCVGWYQYPTRSYVQAYEPPHRFIWLSGPGFKKPPLGQLWGFELTPVDARSTLVSNLMQIPYMPALSTRPFARITDSILAHELANMRPTLRRLAKVAHAEIIGELQIAREWQPAIAEFHHQPSSMQATPAR